MWNTTYLSYSKIYTVYGTQHVHSKFTYFTVYNFHVLVTIQKEKRITYIINARVYIPKKLLFFNKVWIVHGGGQSVYLSCSFQTVKLFLFLYLYLKKKTRKTCGFVAFNEKKNFSWTRNSSCKLLFTLNYSKSKWTTHFI